jgi:hypothetical protein
VTPEDTILQLRAEADLLQEELEGLYAEKDSIEQQAKFALSDAVRLEKDAREAEFERAEMQMAMRRVNQLYGPFEEFEPWCDRVKT